MTGLGLNYGGRGGMETGIEALLYRHELHCQKVSSIRWAN